MQKDKKRHITDYKFIIEEAIKLLPYGDYRFSISEYPLGYTSITDFFSPDFSERISSDYGVPSKNPEIAKEFFDEIAIIEELLKKYDTSTTKPSDEANLNHRAYKLTNQRAYAIQIWDWYAIPWRFLNGLIHIIKSPHDIYGTPIIYSFDPKEFLVHLAKIEEDQMQSFVNNEKKLDIWRTIGQIFIFVSIIALFVYIGRFFK